MEIVYLILSILATFLTSLPLSILLLLRTFFTRLLPRATATTNSVAIYQGIVWHERRRPVHHSFRYSVRYALYNLDHSAVVCPPADHLSADEARVAAETAGPVYLLTIPPSVGYEQNPLSLYYCYDIDEDDESAPPVLKKCIAEVTNTPWGERVRFVFNPNLDIVAKPLHVSPFMDMQGNWTIKTNDPGDSLSVVISVKHPELGDYFVATLKAKRLSSPMIDHAFYFWLMPHRVALWIYWHAFKLWWKNVQFIQHPRYTNPTYREEAILRDQKLQCSETLAKDKGKCPQVVGYNTENSGITNERDHKLRWRDAKWPWC